MAVRFDLDIKRGDVLKVWPEDLIVDQTKNGRFIQPDITALRQDIKDNGQRDPVSVRPVVLHGGERGLELVKGYSRWRSITDINKHCKPEERRRILCLLIDTNEEGAFTDNIRDNYFRNQTTIIDDAHNVQRLADVYHWDDARIREFYKNPDGTAKSEAWLANLRKLVRLPFEHQMRIAKGEWAATVGYMAADLPEDIREGLLEDVAKNGKVTLTRVITEARKRGAIPKGKVSMRMPEYRKVLEYIQSKEGENPKLVKLMKAHLALISNDMPEPDFIGLLHRMFPKEGK